MSRLWLRQTILTVVCVALGFLLVAQFRTHDSITSDVRNMSPDELSALISRLIEDNAKMQREIATLTSENSAYEQNNKHGISQLDDLVARLNRLKGRTGAVQVRGEGLLITINYALGAEHVMALFNEIRNAGAEAIAINSQRIVAHSRIDERDGALLIDGQPQQQPYQIAALGDSATLMGALNRLGGLLQIWRDIDGVAIKIEPSLNLTLPRHGLPPVFRYAQPAP